MSAVSLALIDIITIADAVPARSAAPTPAGLEQAFVVLRATEFIQVAANPDYVVTLRDVNRRITASGHETTDTEPGFAVTKDDYSLERRRRFSGARCGAGAKAWHGTVGALRRHR